MRLAVILLVLGVEAKTYLEKVDRGVETLTSKTLTSKKLKDKHDGEKISFENDEKTFGVPETFDANRDYSAAEDGFDGWFENFNWTKYIEGDDIAEKFFAAPLTRAPMTLKQRLEYRKFKMLKLMVMYLQAIPLFGKYCYYGCYCFPNVGEDFTVGIGKPIDEVDKKCRNFANCYKCVGIDYKSSCKQQQPYSFEGREDPVTRNKYLVCKNSAGSCRRALCECDKRLSESLAEVEWYWVPLYHANWGGFDKKDWCATGSQSKSETVSRAGEEKSEPIYRCCGRYPDRSPYQYKNAYGEDRRCCDSKTYDPEFLQCCRDPEDARGARQVKTIGTCARG